MKDAENIPELAVDGVSIDYGGRHVLTDISLTVSRGELLAIFGPNGAGKSTLLRAIMGFVDVSKGMITLGCRDITPLPTYQRVRLGLSYLVQEDGIFPSLRVIDNLEVATAILDPKAGKDAIRRILDTWPHLSNQLLVRAGLLSGGQRQMLALAMAVVQNPRVLLLDEPTTGLAPEVTSKTLEHIQELNRKTGVTIIIVEQRMQEAAKIATRSLILNSGGVYMERNKPGEWSDTNRIEDYFSARSPHS